MNEMLTDVKFVVIAPMNESDASLKKRQEELNSDGCIVFRENEREPVWRQLNARNHDFFLFDRLVDPTVFFSVSVVRSLQMRSTGVPHIASAQQHVVPRYAERAARGGRLCSMRLVPIRSEPAPSGQPAGREDNGDRSSTSRKSIASSRK